jgi:hypothetical protein
VVRYFPNVHYIRLDTHRGPAVARNAGIAASKGRYIAFLDDDDIWLPHRLRVQLPILESHPTVGVVYGQHVARRDNEVYDSPWPHDASRPPSGNVFALFLMEDFISVDTLLVRREWLEKVKGFDEAIETMEHYDLCLRLAFHVPFHYIPGPVAVQNLSNRPVSTYWLGKSYGGGLADIVEKRLAELPDSQEYAEVKRQARVAVLTRTVDMLSAVGDVARLRSDVLALLQRNSWMVTDRTLRPILREKIRQVAEAIIRVSKSPFDDLLTFCADLRTANGARGVSARLLARAFGLQVLTEARRSLLGGDLLSAGRYLKTAVALDPQVIARPKFWRLALLRLAGSPGSRFYQAFVTWRDQ